MRKLRIKIVGDPRQLVEELQIDRDLMELVWLIRYRRMVKARAERQ